MKEYSECLFKEIIVIITMALKNESSYSKWVICRNKSLEYFIFEILETVSQNK